jgi:hypothetical protein
MRIGGRIRGYYLDKVPPMNSIDVQSRYLHHNKYALVLLLSKCCIGDALHYKLYAVIYVCIMCLLEKRDKLNTSVCVEFVEVTIS